jgi:hypothetical protein
MPLGVALTSRQPSGEHLAIGVIGVIGVIGLVGLVGVRIFADNILGYQSLWAFVRVHEIDHGLTFPEMRSAMQRVRRVRRVQRVRVMIDDEY